MNRILVALDGSDSSWKALDLAIDFAKAHDCDLVLLHVVPYEPMPEALREFAKAEHMHVEEASYTWHQSGAALGDRITAEAEKRAQERGVDRLVKLVVEGQPAQSILAAVEEQQIGMIVLGSRGLSDAKGLMLGSVSHKVANLAPCTCVTVK